MNKGIIEDGTYVALRKKGPIKGSLCEHIEYCPSNIGRHDCRVCPVSGSKPMFRAEAIVCLKNMNLAIKEVGKKELEILNKNAPKIMEYIL